MVFINNSKSSSFSSAFTLIELLIVIGILAVLATVTLLVINPAQLVKQSRDGNRITEINQLNQALLLFQSFGGSNTNMGNINTVYISLPAINSSNTNCSDYPTLPALPSGWAYHCSPLASYRNIDSTGWVPVDFTFVQSSAGTLFSTLPIDPTQSADLSFAASNGYFYTYIHSSWAVSAGLESDKYLSTTAANDGGKSATRFELGNDLALDANLPASTGGGGSTVPGAPQNVVSTEDSSQVVLNWQAPTSDGGSTITNYEIYRGTLADGESFLTEVGNTLTYTDVSINPTISYYYEVVAKNSIGTGPKSGLGSTVCTPNYSSITYGYNSGSSWVAGGTYKFFNSSDNNSAGSSPALGCQQNTTVCTTISGFSGCSRICPNYSWISGSSIYVGGKYWYSSWYNFGSFPSVCYYNCNAQISCSTYH